MSQSIIQTPPSAWIDITDQVTWHANAMVESGTGIKIYGLFYNPAVHMCMCFARFTSVNNGDQLIKNVPTQYLPSTFLRFPGICTKTSGADVDARFAQITCDYQQRYFNVSFTENTTFYRLLFSATWPCM